jgi:hypothetical protein
MQSRPAHLRRARARRHRATVRKEVEPGLCSPCGTYRTHAVARMERSEMRDGLPDCASLHPGYSIIGAESREPVTRAASKRSARSRHTPSVRVG